MEANKVEQLLLLNASKLPPESMGIVRSKLLEVDDATMAHVVFSQLKDPTIALIISILLGAYGIDRFYIGDVGLGIGKLLTCAGAFVWYLIDIFLIMDATRKKNLESILIQLN